MPLAYTLHLAEEWWGGEGFASWTARVLGAEVSETRFLVVNGIAWPLFTTLTILALFRPSWRWFWVCFAALVVLNASLHLLGSLASGSYSPGLITGLALYLPLGIATLRGRFVESPVTYRWGVAAGIGIHALVAVIAFWPS